MKYLPGSNALLAALMAAGSITAFSSANSAVPESCVKGVDMATLGSKSIVGQGPHGEKAASAEELSLTDAEAEKVKAGHFKVGISMQNGVGPVGAHVRDVLNEGALEVNI